MPTVTSFKNKQSLPQNQKGFAHLLILLLLIIGIVAGIYLVQHPAIFNPRASVDGNICRASTATEFKACLAQAQTDTPSFINEILVTKQIICASSTDCTFGLLSRARELLIHGAPNSSAGFKRVQNFNYVLLTLGGSFPVTKVTLKDLIFEDDKATACNFIKEDDGSQNYMPDNETPKCNSPLLLQSTVNTSDLTDTTLDHITVLHAKNHGIQINLAKNLTIKNSIIYDSGGDGIYFKDDTGKKQRELAGASACNYDSLTFSVCDILPALLSKNITIQDNLIAENEIAGLEFYGLTEPESDTSKRNIIKGNLFVHNHRNAKYIQCPNEIGADGVISQPGGHCSGGQLAVSRSRHVTVSDNIIRDGLIDSPKPTDRFMPNRFDTRGIDYEHQPVNQSEGTGPLHDNGIETSESIWDVEITNNKIYNNSSAGVFADYVGDLYRVAAYPAPTPRAPGTIQVYANNVYANNPGEPIPENRNFNKNRQLKNADGSQYGPTQGDLGGFADGFYVTNNNNKPNQISLPKAFVFADPPICSPQGQQDCNTKIRWYSEDQNNLSVGIKDDSVTVLGRSADGSADVPWLNINGGVFEIRSGSNRALASVFATRYSPNTPTASQTPVVSPSPTAAPSSSANVSATGLSTNGYISAPACTIPTGQTRCTSTITYLVNNPTGPVQLTIKESGGMIMANPAPVSGRAYAVPFEWVARTPQTLEIRDGNHPAPRPPVATATIKATSLLSASPNPCSLVSGKCTTNITYASNSQIGASYIIIRLYNNGNGDTSNFAGNAFAGDPANGGSIPYRYISSTPVTFKAFILHDWVDWSRNPEIGSVIVKGQ